MILLLSKTAPTWQNCSLGAKDFAKLGHFLTQFGL